MLVEYQDKMLKKSHMGVPPAPKISKSSVIIQFWGNIPSKPHDQNLASKEKENPYVKIEFFLSTVLGQPCSCCSLLQSYLAYLVMFVLWSLSF